MMRDAQEEARRRWRSRSPSSRCGASLAQAELTERGDLFVKFSGGIAPDALPRHTRAPIAVSVAGTVRTLSGERPPALRRIRSRSTAAAGSTPRACRSAAARSIEPSSAQEALRPAGRPWSAAGSYDAGVAFPEQAAFPLAAGGSSPSTPSSTASARSSPTSTARDPVPISRIIVFHIRESSGTYGTVLTGALPASLNRYGYLKRIVLSLHRNFTYRGRTRSYLSAACDAPAGFPGASSPSPTPR